MKIMRIGRGGLGKKFRKISGPDPKKFGPHGPKNFIYIESPPSHHFKTYPNQSFIDKRPRLIMRGNATHRLILNTKLWAQMMCMKANEKSIKINAFHFETGKIVAYLRFF